MWLHFSLAEQFAKAIGNNWVGYLCWETHGIHIFTILRQDDILTGPLGCVHCASLLHFQQPLFPLSKWCGLCHIEEKKNETGHWCCTLWPRGRCRTTWVDGVMHRTYPTEKSAFVCSMLRCGHMLMYMYGTADTETGHFTIKAHHLHQEDITWNI